MPKDNPNNINPGTSLRRKAIPGCKCICLVGTGLVVAAVALLVATVVARAVKQTLAPHATLFHDKAFEAVMNRATVVQPLITRLDEFDILVTVWLRNGGSLRHEGPKRLKKNPVKSPRLPQTNKPDEEDEMLPVEQDSEVVEIPVYSEVVFQRVSLTDKHIYKDINFSVPTAQFRAANLSNYDLRASVVLVPHSPSLLDRTTNYSNWIPDSVKPLPVRPYEPEYISTLADHIIDTFSDTFPLLEFHGIPSKCPKAESKKAEHNPFIEDEDEAAENVPAPADLGPNTQASSTLKTTDGRNAIYSHPYIVTRTQIRVVDETGIFNRKAYIKEHKQLKETSCGQRSYVYPGRYFCQKQWLTNGHWETQLQLTMMNDTTGEYQTEWAYGPYVVATRYGFGQHDLVPIPVNRETCSERVEADSAEEPETLDVTWHLSYTGRTPAKMGIAELAGTSKYYAFNETELEKYTAQEHASLAHGMWGVPFGQGIYARTRMGIYFFVLASTVIETILDVRYWFTRKTTEGISIQAVNLVAWSTIVQALGSLYKENAMKGYTIPGWIALLISTIVKDMSVAILMLKAVYRVYFHWWTASSWFPTARRAEPNRNERISQRLEAELGWMYKGGLFFGFLVVCWLSDFPNYIIAKSNFALPEEDKGNDFIHMLFYAMRTVGHIQQLIMNAKTGKYAGAYALTTVLAFTVTVLTSVDQFSTILGKTKYTMDLTSAWIIDLMIQGVAVYQALILPRVSQEAEGLHDE